MKPPPESPHGRAETQFQRQRTSAQRLPEDAEEDIELAAIVGTSIQQPCPISKAMLAINAHMKGNYFTHHQSECAKCMGMPTHEYVNFVRGVIGLSQIDWEAIFRCASSKQT